MIHSNKQQILKVNQNYYQKNRWMEHVCKSMSSTGTGFAPTEVSLLHHKPAAFHKTSLNSNLNFNVLIP